jgi:hypothetical protein
MPDRNPRPLPVTIEEIDADWLTAALRTYAPEATVRGVRIVDMMRSTCTKIRLHLDLNEAGRLAGIPETVILKGGFEPHSRHMHYMHEKEARGYRDILPVLDLPAPSCWFADYDADRRQGIVIMEDLVARGVTFCSALKPQTHEQVARRLERLAQFHARTWDSPDFAAGGRWDWVDDIPANQRIYFDQYLTKEVWPRFIDSARGAAASVRFHDLEWMIGALDKISLLSRGLPHCLIHGDTHLGNLYIDPDGTPGFYDPIPGRAPGMLEVSYHVAGALDTADRARWEGALVRHYLDELVRQGVDAPSFDEAMHQYGAFLAYGYCVFIINEPIFQPEAINTAYTARFSAAMIAHDTMRLLSAV